MGVKKRKLLLLVTALSLSVMAK